MSHEGDRRESGTILARIDANVENLVNNFANHMQQDKEDFQKVDVRLDVVHKRINDLAKYVYIGLGIFAALEIGIQFLKN